MTRTQDANMNCIKFRKKYEKAIGTIPMNEYDVANKA
jgi:hypothetical protein